jgi:hypothetical protein
MDKYDLAPIGGPCCGHPTEIWFPPSRRGHVSTEERKQRIANEQFAKDTCLSCDQRMHCLEYSLRHEPFGTWGGYTEIERAHMRVNRGINLTREGKITIPGGSMNAATGTVTLKRPQRSAE